MGRWEEEEAARRTHWTVHLGRHSLIPEFMRALLGEGGRVDGKGPRIAQGEW